VEGRATTKRRHNCHAESNVRMILCYWRGEEIVTEWGCRRCPTTWETSTTTAQLEAERMARLQEQVAEAVRRHGR
jgi:hypothetical protein